jgi:hypothetical protein
MFVALVDTGSKKYVDSVVLSATDSSSKETDDV